MSESGSSCSCRCRSPSSIGVGGSPSYLLLLGGSGALWTLTGWVVRSQARERIVARLEAADGRSLATVGAAIALLFLFSDNEAEQSRPTVSPKTVRELQGDVRRLNKRSEAARKARSEADTADDRSRSLREQVDDLENRVASADENDEATQRQIAELNDELSDDIQQLREEVERLQRDRGR